MITYRPEISLRLQQAASSLERIGQLLPERAQSACAEASAILHECAAEYAPPAESKYPNHARDSARRLAERMKPTGVKPTGIASE